MSYEKDKLDSFVTSASLSTALAPYVTSASVAAAIGAINLAPYMTSDSLSAAVATDVLTVRGAASVSATLSAGAVTVAGRPVGMVLLGYQTFTNVTSFSFSGSWSDYAILEVSALYRMSGTATVSLSIFTDGGTTPILNFVPNPAAGPSTQLESQILGGDGRPDKYLYGTWRSSTNITSGYSLTANTGFVNCYRMSTSRTISNGMAILIGYRKT